MSTKDATAAAVSECKKMTEYMIEALKEHEGKTKNYEELLAEWNRRQGLYNSSSALYHQLCSNPDGCLTPGSQGGVQRLGCHPMCHNWIRMNPSFANHKPSAPIPPDLGTFVCSICSQSVDIDATAGKDVNFFKNAINQQMSCTTTLEKQISDMKEPNNIGDVEPPPVDTNKIYPTQPTISLISDNTQAIEQKKDNTTTYVIIGIIFLIIIIIGILMAMIFLGDYDEVPKISPTKSQL